MRHELEARLRQIRREKESIETRIAQEDQENAEREARYKVQKEAQERQRSTSWGRTKELFGFQDKAAKGDFVRDGVDLLFGLVKLPLDVGIRQRLDDLELEEARILDQLDSR